MPTRLETGILITSPEDELRAELGRLSPRLKLFEAIENGKSIFSSFTDYRNNIDHIVSSGFNRWFRRTSPDRNLLQARNNELRKIFQRDAEVAYKFKKGVEINGRTTYLKDLIEDGRQRMAEIKRKL